jgi:DNA polymerase (family 10)
LKINEYGVFSGEKRVGGKEEEEIFHLVGLPWIPPELREDRGEILSAREGKLPVLVRVEDLRGDLHCHTRYSDGKNTVREMVEEARSLGYEYLAITDHSPRLGIARGVTWDRLRKEWEEIDRLNEEMSGFKVLKGMEVEILEDGSLDIPVEVARELDLVIGAVHSQFHLSLEKQTTRILKAMEFPYFTFLAHPTGRLLKKRSSYEVDIERIIAFARERGCFLEINGQPMRLDLNDIYAKVAKEAGVLLVISSDAHSKGDLSRIRYGVDQGRRGWLTAKDVVNTRPLPELLTLLKKTRLNS